VKGLQLLKDNGFRLATLTNSPPLALKQQLINSNLTDYFEQALSISLKKYKPARNLFMGSKELIKTRGNANDCSTRLGFSRCITCWFRLALLPVKGSPCTLYPAP
jgi:hypothetical protein